MTRYLLPTIYAIILHMLIILLLCNYIQPWKTRAIGSQILHAYVVKQPIIIAKHKSELHHSASLLHKSPGNAISAPAEIQKSSNTAPQYGKNNQLLIMLHNQIQQYINDNNNDLLTSFGHRAATVQFLLTLQGQADAVHIIKSSGSKMLDNLAFQAVNSIEAANLAKKYLIRDTYFRIMVYFK